MILMLADAADCAVAFVLSAERTSAGPCQGYLNASWACELACKAQKLVAAEQSYTVEDCPEGLVEFYSC